MSDQTTFMTLRIRLTCDNVHTLVEMTMTWCSGQISECELLSGRLTSNQEHTANIEFIGHSDIGTRDNQHQTKHNLVLTDASFDTHCHSEIQVALRNFISVDLLIVLNKVWRPSVSFGRGAGSLPMTWTWKSGAGLMGLRKKLVREINRSENGDGLRRDSRRTLYLRADPNDASATQTSVKL